MFNKIRHAYHSTKGEQALKEYSACLARGEDDKAAELLEEAKKHKQKINEIFRKSMKKDLA